MPVLALWSAPRSRSTVFFRSMVERGDLITLHEPFSNLADFGETDVEGHTFDSPALLLTWLADQTHDVRVFLKDTTDRRHGEVLADRHFLAEARHAFLIRRPEEIAASFYALKPDMRIDHIGLEALHALHAAVRDAGGNRPVIVDSDDLVVRPGATMAAYCVAVGLPFIPQALTWGPGERPEWRRSVRWHADVNASSGVEQRDRRYTHSRELRRASAVRRPPPAVLRTAPRPAAQRRGVGTHDRLLTEQSATSPLATPPTPDAGPATRTTDQHELCRAHGVKVYPVACRAHRGRTSPQ